jgi:hypothetical protein
MMTTETTGTVVDGALKLDVPLAFPNQSRVRVVVEPLFNWRTRFKTGLKEWKAYCQVHPVHSGRRYTRDELHERR